ncbi:hypothetical protein JCM10213v2_005998 [Rhodosporidiobolus nylandii]
MSHAGEIPVEEAGEAVNVVKADAGALSPSRASFDLPDEILTLVLEQAHESVAEESESFGTDLTNALLFSLARLRRAPRLLSHRIVLYPPAFHPTAVGLSIRSSAEQKRQRRAQQAEELEAMLRSSSREREPKARGASYVADHAAVTGIEWVDEDADGEEYEEDEPESPPFKRSRSDHGLNRQGQQADTLLLMPKPRKPLCIGASYGTSKSGVGIAAMGVLRPDLMMKCIIPVVMAGIIAIYGLVVSVLISGELKSPMPLYTGFIQLGAGLSVGLAGLSAGFAIGIVGNAGVRGVAQQSRVFVGMILILIFAEVLGLYGLIVALILNTRATDAPEC